MTGNANDLHRCTARRQQSNLLPQRSTCGLSLLRAVISGFCRAPPRLFRELAPVHGPVRLLVEVLVSAQDVLQRSADHEILLLEAQLLPLVGAVVRVEDGGDGLRALLLQDGADIVARIEGLQVELSRGLGAPQAQVVAVGALPPRNGRVVRHRDDLFSRVPAELLAAIRVLHGHVSVVLDGVEHVQALDLPGVAVVEPVIRLLSLEAVRDGLPEHPVLVPDPVPPGREIQRGHGVQEARGEAAQSAVAEGGVPLLLHQVLKLVPL